MLDKITRNIHLEKTDALNAGVLFANQSYYFLTHEIENIDPRICWLQAREWAISSDLEPAQIQILDA